MPTEGPERGQLRQLASGPVGCEVCGCEFTPDGRTLFLSIQHPGEGGTFEKPRSHWPDGNGLPARGPPWWPSNARTAVQFDQERVALAFRLGQLVYQRSDVEQTYENARYQARNL